MNVTQLSIFLENRSGRLAEVTEILGKNAINIRALALADTSDFGILRVIVNDPSKAAEILKREGFTVSETEVLAIEVEDRPGGLAGVLKTLSSESVNVEYMYAFLEKRTESALIIFRIEEIERTEAILRKHGIKILSGKDLYNL
jgi:hypothetical protein